MRIFCDTSALAKRYVQEPGSEELEELFSSTASEIFISTLAFVELASALSRKLQNKEIAAAEVGEAIKEFEEDWYEMFAKIPLEDMLAAEAAAIALEFSLKGADAVHLASAKVTDAELFVASDNRLIRVAKKMGINSYNPESGSYK
ncbi:MAG: type II toxin-antitoxin system VapC family toxin [Candidatus Aminicenantes bacterium]|nr:MAG: type II toxin-antitoxin system VapC family toxin [Candidatus Aminicenantes bacterium]